MPRPPAARVRRRPHPAATARRVTAVASVVAGLGLSGMLAVSAAGAGVSPTATKPGVPTALAASSSGRSAWVVAVPQPSADRTAAPSWPAPVAVTSTHGS